MDAASGRTHAAVAYLVASYLLLLRGDGFTPGALLMTAVPGVIFGASVPDWRILVVPAVGLGALVLHGYLSEPRCDYCAQYDIWTLISISLVLLILAAGGLSIGIGTRRLVSRWPRDRPSGG